MNQTSNSLPMSVPLAQRLRFVLVDTSHPGNVGATARAMKTMGFSELVLVNPRYPDVLLHEDAIAFAEASAEPEVATVFEDIHAPEDQIAEFRPPIGS
jgi:tRNA C32,U32 (ribose-2'-O)-methylase TrmJ